MRLASKDAREFRRLAESFGWWLDGVTSNGHLRWMHREHGELVTSATPSSWWWARRDLYAAMGEQMPARSMRRRSRRNRAPQAPNQINALCRVAHKHGHRMSAEFAERLLANADGDLDAAMAMLRLLLERADRLRAKRARRQPWQARPARRLASV